ncbi:MAG TPA: c-type cytochrome [Candidatus Lambdaproteobacteria bacterium]|nr:c-type cytochrome [Candidatus Lambdaproteobacteria bacterium]
MSTNTHATRRRKALLLGWGILLVLLTAGGYLAFQGTSADALNQPPTSNQIAQGRKIYQQNCAACHGVQAGGQDHKQPKGGQADGLNLLLR